MTSSIIFGVWSVVIGLGLVFYAGFLGGIKERWYWIVLCVVSGVFIMISQVAKFLAFIGPLLK